MKGWGKQPGVVRLGQTIEGVAHHREQSLFSSASPVCARMWVPMTRSDYFQEKLKLQILSGEIDILKCFPLFKN